MIDWILKGSVLGLSIGLLIGPLFFALIHAGIEYGFRRGVVFALGTWMSDVCLLLITYFLLSEFIVPTKVEEINPTVNFICAGILIIIGLYTILDKRKPIDPNYTPKAKDLFGLLSKGFIVNTINPTAFIIWLGLGTMIKSLNKSHSDLYTFSFYLGVVSMIIFLDSAKVLLGKTISKRIEAGILHKIKGLSGFAFIMAGVIILLKSNW